MSDDTQKVKGGIDKTFEAFQEQRERSIADLRAVQVAATASLRQEILRVEKEYGADHERTQMLKDAFETSNQWQRATEITQELSSIRPVQAKADEVVVQGRAADKDGRGIEGVMAALTDQDSKPIAGVDAVRTDTNGYFAIRVPSDLLEKIGAQNLKGGFVTIASEKGTTLQQTRVSLSPAAKQFVSLALDRESVRPAPTKATVFSRKGSRKGETDSNIKPGNK